MSSIEQRLKSYADRFAQWSPNFKNVRPPGEKYYGHLIALLIAWMLADLFLLWYRPQLLPTEAPPIAPKILVTKTSQLRDYNAILERNFFSEDGKILPPLRIDKTEGPNFELDPVPTQLPLTLLGTIVHFNTQRSIATVQSNSANQAQSFNIGESLFGSGEITKIERKRVIFRNNNLGRLEYIEIKDDDAFDFSIQSKAPTAPTGLVQRLGNFSFTIQRKDLENLTANLSTILQQARMEPRFGPDGDVDAFCFTNIQPNTPYEAFGFQVGDCIKGVNGQRITSPGQAMEAYEALKSANNIQLQMERSGRDETFNYTIQ